MKRGGFLLASLLASYCCYREKSREARQRMNQKMDYSRCFALLCFAVVLLLLVLLVVLVLVSNGPITRPFSQPTNQTKPANHPPPSPFISHYHTPASTTESHSHPIPIPISLPHPVQPPMPLISEPLPSQSNPIQSTRTPPHLVSIGTLPTYRTHGTARQRQAPRDAALC
jgi:hypothetical protein